MLIGLFLGLCVAIYGWKNLWWVGIILIGALLNTGVQFLGLKQQKKILDDLEKQFKEPEIIDDSQESLNVEKLDEMPDYETANKVDVGLNPTQQKKFSSHPDTSNKEKEEIENN